jgi:26S proteasome regulatory subunit N9
MIESTQKKLDEVVGVTMVHASFYRVSAIYLKEIGDYAAYYKESLRYLGCEDLDRLSAEEKRVQAQLLGFAALLGQDVYNFGELVGIISSFLFQLPKNTSCSVDTCYEGTHNIF